MYTSETLAKFARKVRENVERYEAIKAADIKMTISGGNRKIGQVMNVSLPPIFTCHNCKECKKLCYDIKACIQYASCLDARVRNMVILQKDRADYFGRIEKAISRRKKNKFFRWHVAGDIVDYDYLTNMARIARNHPDFLFWTYTKNYGDVNDFVAMNGGSIAEAIPDNLIIMFSEWRGMPMVNPFGFPVFTVRFKDENEAEFKAAHGVGFKCPGNCDACKPNKRGCIGGESTYCDEH